ncbi:unnamed protein product [Leptosia nina]|uniref:Uncharacterized protein n=1 Tax=Leptosia nina TaxID=320188 RepID=A0AAV1JS32_9NEOP
MLSTKTFDKALNRTLYGPLIVTSPGFNSTNKVSVLLSLSFVWDEREREFWSRERSVFVVFFFDLERIGKINRFDILYTQEYYKCSNKGAAHDAITQHPQRN